MQQVPSSTGDADTDLGLDRAGLAADLSTRGESAAVGWPSLLFLNAADASRADGRAAPVHFRDLNLDQVIDAVTAGEQDDLAGIFHTPLSHVDSIEFRHEVWRDLEDAAAHDSLRRFTEGMDRTRRRLAVGANLRYRRQTQRWRLAAAETYVAAVAALADELATAAPRSRALRSVEQWLDSYLTGPAFTALATDVRNVRAALTEVQYCLAVRGGSVRVSRYEGQPDYAAALEQTFERFRAGGAERYTAEVRETQEMNHVEAAILDQVAQLFPDAFGQLGRFAAEHEQFLDQTVARFDREARFYLAYGRYLTPLRDAGIPFCYPRVSGSKDELVRDTVDIALAARLVQDGTAVITNDLVLSHGERICVVSGPNQGGKTTYARSVGQLHYLARLGLPVVGSSARLLLCDEVFTHFAKEEHVSDLRGKLQDELLRMRDILDAATSESIVILNESFASTTTQDALYVASRILQRIVDLDAICVYVTFLDELASLGPTVVSAVSGVVPEDPRTRTYKIERRPADGLAHAVALAEKYGLTYRQARERMSR